MGNVFQSLLRAEARRSEREAKDTDPEAGAVSGDPGGIRWDGAIFERVSSIERQLAALEEGLGKRVPELEQRLLHLLDGRLSGLEAELRNLVSSVSSELAFEAERRRNEQRRILWALAAVGLLVLLF